MLGATRQHKITFVLSLHHCAAIPSLGPCALGTHGLAPCVKVAQGCSRPSCTEARHAPAHLACKIRVLRTSKRGSELNGSRPSCAEARHGFCRQKKKRADCVRSNQLSVKKFPAPCYSPIVKFTVPSPLEALTTVFGKGTCVTPPPWAP